MEYPLNRTNEIVNENLSILSDLVNSSLYSTAGIARYLREFYIPYMISMKNFHKVESEKVSSESFADNFSAYIDFFKLNSGLVRRTMVGCFNSFLSFCSMNFENEGVELLESMQEGDIKKMSHGLLDLFAKQLKVLRFLAIEYPRAISSHQYEFGFEYNYKDSQKVAETEHFELYQVLPSDESITVKENGKPILVVPPYVLGANILAFSPEENKSYVHAYANQGIPVYIRIVKNIDSTPAVQTMTPEDDVIDTKFFCETIRQRHRKPVTLNGYCQGGFLSLCSILSGELDGVVDAFITCVSPIDGSRSKGLADFLKSLSSRFNDLDYGKKSLPNGNTVADGNLLAWVYKLSDMENESPAAIFYRDLMMFAAQNTPEFKINKTAARLNYWLTADRSDIPLSIADLSFTSYNTPITDDGTLPVKLFDRTLNLKRIQEKKIPWLICYGKSDTLVEKEAALAPLDHIEAEVTAFPKGHVAMATSWSNPESKCALQKRFGKNNSRGPVRFQLDLDEAMDQKAAAESPATASDPAENQSTEALSPKADAEKTAGVKEESAKKAPKAEETKKSAGKKPAAKTAKTATKKKTARKTAAKKKKTGTTTQAAKKKPAAKTAAKDRSASKTSKTAVTKKPAAETAKAEKQFADDNTKQSFNDK